jgi:copper transport protein
VAVHATAARSLPVKAAASATVHFHSSRIMAQVTLSSGQAGPVRTSVALASGQDTGVDPKEVTLILANPETGIEPLERKAWKAGRSWEVDSLDCPRPDHGRWRSRSS